MFEGSNEVGIMSAVTVQGPDLIQNAVLPVEDPILYIKRSADRVFLHAKPWIPGGEKSILTVDIH